MVGADACGCWMRQGLACADRNPPHFCDRDGHDMHGKRRASDLIFPGSQIHPEFSPVSREGTFCKPSKLPPKFILPSLFAALARILFTVFDGSYPEGSERRQAYLSVEGQGTLISCQLAFGLEPNKWDRAKTQTQIRWPKILPPKEFSSI